MTLSKVLIGRKASVASEHPLASIAGYDVLKRGGNAFDASVATSFTLAVTMHHIGGLGGDFFGMFYEAKTGKVHCLNASGWAPSGLTPEMFQARGEHSVPIHGGTSCVVPGQVAGIFAMHKKLGREDFQGLLNAPMTYASEGFPCSEGLSRAIAATFERLSPEARETFAPNGRPPTPGDWIRQEKLGKLLDDLAKTGPESFYNGSSAEALCSVLRRQGVEAQIDDFADYAPEWVQPLTLDYRGTMVHETPPNSMGATSLLMLKLLSERNGRLAGPQSAGRIRNTMEAAEAAYQRKDEILGDPRFAKINIETFLDPKASQRAYAGRVQAGDTTAFSVADAEGNLVSGIQSLFRHFGSLVFVPEIGVMLNDRASAFRMQGPNTVAPRKRPLHTLSSVILSRRDNDHFAIGTSGGDYRPIQHALLITNIVDYEMTLEQAVDHPRFLWSEGRDLMVEEGYEKFGSERYDIKPLPLPGRTGVCQAVQVHDGYRKAVCDVRGDGVPAGF